MFTGRLFWTCQTKSWNKRLGQQWVLLIMTRIFPVKDFQLWWSGVLWIDFQQILPENMNMLEKPRFSLKKKAAAVVINHLLSEQKTISNTLMNPFCFFPLPFQNLTLLQDHLLISSDYHKNHCLLDHSATQATFLSLYFSTWKIGQDFWKCVYKCLNDWHFYIASCVSAILWKEQFFREVQLQHSLRHNFYSLISESLT